MFEERKRARTREENVKFVDFKDLALQPCSLAALQPCSLAALQPCSLAALQPCSLAALQPCSLAALQPCSLAALQPCSLAGYVNLNYLNFPKYFPPDINFFFEENLMFADKKFQYGHPYIQFCN
ncbi:hypothetical protein G3B51_002468 [Salmonella enterica]|nr:hypothetical protein [Salmonella enterica]